MDDIYTLTYTNDVVSGSYTSLHNTNPQPAGPSETSGYLVVDYTTMQVLDSSYKPIGSSSVQFDPASDQYTVTVYQQTAGASGGNASYVYSGESPYTFDEITSNYLSNPGRFYSTESGYNQPVTPTQGDTVCFAAATQVLTTRGNITVEDLAPGDLVLTVGGGLRPIRWIGSRTINRPTFEQWPIRIRAGAFGGARPKRDLFLSPGHPVLVGDQLVPIMCLINGTTVARHPVESVTYWHVELDQHDVLLAEGLPCESYIDLGSRPWFGGSDERLHDSDFIAPDMPGRCRPVVIDGPVVEAERLRLDCVFETGLAVSCAWPSGLPIG